MVCISIELENKRDAIISALGKEHPDPIHFL